MKLKRKLELRDWLNFAAILLILGLFIFVGVNYSRVFGTVDTGDLLSSAENLKNFILSYGRWAILVIILLHMLHVILSFIPSVIVQFVGGLIFGFSTGMVTGVIGIALGTATSFYLSRFLGKRVVTLLISEKTQKKLDAIISSDTSTIILLMLFILPTPKDFFAYIIGLTDMKATKFFAISAIGRLPGMLVATYLGAHLLERNYLLLGIIVGASTILGILLVVFKNRLFKLLTPKKEEGDNDE